MTFAYHGCTGIVVCVWLMREEQQIYVEKSEDVHGLFWSCQTCIVNKLDVLTELEQEIEEMKMKIKKETRQEKMKKRKKNCKWKNARENKRVS